VAELTQKRLERQLRERTKEGEAAVARCDGLAVVLASLQVKFDANSIECNGLNATNKRLERQLRLRKKDAEDAETAGVELQRTLTARCEEVANMQMEVTRLEKISKVAETKMRSVDLQYVGKCADLTTLRAKFDNHEERDTKYKRLMATRMEKVKKKVDDLTAVRTL
jgi:cobyrinic acid a,c-diamide synthase